MTDQRKDTMTARDTLILGLGALLGSTAAALTDHFVSRFLVSVALGILAGLLIFAATTISERRSA